MLVFPVLNLHDRFPRAPLVLCAAFAALLTLLCGSFRITTNGVKPLLQPEQVLDGAWLETHTSAYLAADAVQWSAVQTLSVIVFGALLAAALVAAFSFCTLLLTRYSARRSELATRAALGAAPSAIVRELARPIVRILSVGGTPGLAFGLLAVLLTRASWPGVVTGAAGRSLLSGILGGLAGLLLLGCITLAVLWLFVLRDSLANALRAGDRASAALAETRLREFFTGAQIASSLVLLVTGTVLAGASRGAGSESAAGEFESRLLVSPQALDGFATRPLGERVARLEQMLGGAGLPVASAESIASAGALLGIGLRDRLYSECDVCVYSIGPVPTTLIDLAMHSVGPRYFTVQGTQMVRGRDFTAADRADAQPVVIVNDSFVRALFGPQGSGLDRVVRLQLGAGEAHRIVGVVPDQRGSGAGAQPVGTPVVYFSALQHPPVRFDVITQAPAGDAATAPAGVRTLAEMRTTAEAPLRAVGLSVRALSLLCFLLSTYGLYASTSALVRERRRDLGIRVMLGSTPRGLSRYVALYALRIVIVGSLFGLPAVWLITLLLQTVSPDAQLQPGTGIGAVALLTVATVLGALRPARAAASAC